MTKLSCQITSKMSILLYFITLCVCNKRYLAYTVPLGSLGIHTIRPLLPCIYFIYLALTDTELWVGNWSVFFQSVFFFFYEQMERYDFNRLSQVIKKHKQQLDIIRFSQVIKKKNNTKNNRIPFTALFSQQILAWIEVIMLINNPSTIMKLL